MSRTRVGSATFRIVLSRFAISTDTHSTASAAARIPGGRLVPGRLPFRTACRTSAILTVAMPASLHPPHDVSS